MRTVSVKMSEADATWLKTTLLAMVQVAHDRAASGADETGTAEASAARYERLAAAVDEATTGGQA